MNDDISNLVYKTINDEEQHIKHSFKAVPLSRLFDYVKTKSDNNWVELDDVAVATIKLLKKKKLSLYERLGKNEFIKLDQDELHKTDFFMRPKLYISTIIKKN